MFVRGQFLKVRPGTICKYMIQSRSYTYGHLFVELPFGQVPTLNTEDGDLCMSNTIARHVARKLGKIVMWWSERMAP